RAARYSASRGLRRPPGRPESSAARTLLERAAEVARQSRHLRRHSRRDAALPALRTEGGSPDRRGSQNMSAEDKAFRRTFPVEGEPIVRYTLAERLNHWLAGLTYVYLLLTGLALFSPH